LTNVNVLSYFEFYKLKRDGFFTILSVEDAMQTMLPGAPWLLAHKSMLKVNQPRKVSLYISFGLTAGTSQRFPFLL
jgi:hypothetical protein